MTWLIWRQHRLEGLWALILAGLIGGSIGYVAWQLHLAASGCPQASGFGYCLSDDIFGRIAHAILQFNLFQYGLVVLPALAGAFIGAPLVAREIENRTHHLAWTQGVTRTRWLLTKLALVIVPLITIGAIVGYLEVVFLNVQGPLVNRWDVFDQQSPVTAASTLFALALGLAFGAIIGRSIPAMAATLLTFVVVRVSIAEFIRGSYMAPLRFKSSDLAALSQQANPTAWWLGSPNFYNAAGHALGNSPTGAQQAAYAIQYYQPGDRFWMFQTIESAILTGLALLILGLAVYWVTRRVT